MHQVLELMSETYDRDKRRGDVILKAASPAIWMIVEREGIGPLIEVLGDWDTGIRSIAAGLLTQERHAWVRHCAQCG